MEIFIDNRQDKITIGEEIYNILEKVVEEAIIMEEDSTSYEVSISFVDNEEIRILNRDYRGIDKDTDVLSFPLDNEFDFVELILLGDIIISAEKAFQQSQDLDHSLNREIAYLTAHAMLHLLGYDHMKDEDKIIMRGKEKELMKKINLFRGN